MNLTDKKLDLRVKKTYKALTDSLDELLRHKTFNEITVNEICDNAMVGRGTFYKHFSDKYDFLSFVMNEFISECLNEASKTAPSDNLCEYYKAFFDKFISAFEKNKNCYKRIDGYIVQGVAFSPVVVVYNSLLKHLQDNYSEDDKINRFMAKYLTMAIVIIIVGIIKEDSHNSEETKEFMYNLLEKLFA